MICNKYLSGIFAAFVLMLSACNDSNNFNEIDPEPSEGNEGTVTLTVAPQNQNSSTRADDRIPFISDGSKINVIFYGIYEEKTDGSYELIDEIYSRDITENFWPLKLKFALDLEKNYHVAFWAQKAVKSNGSYNTAPYDVSDLRAVRVDYSNALNNDEDRDAFSAVCEVNKGNVPNSGNVYLHRPFAQINIATAGYDYEGAAVVKPDQVIYKQSQCVVSGVADTYNAVIGKSVTPSSSIKATFQFNKLPAFINIDEPENIYTTQAGEEFLKIKLYNENTPLLGFHDKNTEFFDYFGWSPFICYRDASGNFSERYFSVIHDASSNKITSFEEVSNPTEVQKKKLFKTDYLLAKGIAPATEIFKYLSMCYVLVPEISSKNSATVELTFVIKGQGIEISTGSDGHEIITPTDEEIESVTYTVNNLPVQKNWRSNLIGNSFFIYNAGLILDVVPEYCGDYTQYGEVDYNWRGNDYTNNDFNNNWSWDYNTK